MNREISESPGYARAWANRAVVRYKGGQIALARADAEMALRLDPGNSRPKTCCSCSTPQIRRHRLGNVRPEICCRLNCLAQKRESRLNDGARFGPCDKQLAAQLAKALAHATDADALSSARLHAGQLPRKPLP